ncbi:Membrane carboxypeptidase (penicillin-binding protein) [Micromonospora nigra]|uniref:Membrane carboxypeptidase (Penicillin-binding protein) n=1 Tax=Micromonospora nigra TaxID=145857 RepID=A0A1C6RZI2_9ACTN|nr:transglycosylase domain-containing protein [Micromonospora nigra]SCL22633.1 Membrane carboxypeptidase (penicillin-binding protein) [Micromonospora nigra]
MNSYGDPSSPHGRAQIPGQNGDPGQGGDAYHRQGGDARGSTWSATPEGATPGRAQVTPRAAGGRASVGGSAAVPPQGAAVPPRGGSAAAGSAPVGRAGAGRASVPVSPAPGGRASVPVSPAPGRASVPVSPAPAGRAVVGAASVGSASVSAGRASVGAAPVGGRAAGGGRAAVGGRASVSPAAGGPGGPGGPTGPGRAGRGAGDPGATARAKKRKRMNLLIASFAVFIMLAGIGVVGFTYYSTNVVLPKEIPLPLSTTVYMKDGKTPVARLGNENRTFVTINDIPEHVRHAVAAAEDRNFYRHSGVDYKGIARAAWNNLSGGDKQGASTITQQYARNAYENLKDDSYARKVKEAILASKLNDQFTKDQIMENYLNVIYFGRGAYGIEAAAQTYFKRSASKLNPAQGAVLAAVIKQPVASNTHKGYDPAVNLADAQGRWNYVLDGMVAEGWLSAAERPTEYPKVEPVKKDGNGFGVKSPSGNVVNYVRQEMEQWGICSDSGAADKPTCVDELREGGYRIKTTIDPKMQRALIESAQPGRKGSVLHGQPKNLMAAAVSVEPKTGRVLAYYGGDSGADFDYAGKNTNANGDIVGGHPPGSSFKVYTLAAAINANISVKSHWDSTPFKPEGFKDKVQNAGRNAACAKWCTLQESTVKSYNVPFFHLTEQIGPDKVIDMARRAGVSTMWTVDPPKPYDLTEEKPDKLAPKYFDRVVGYGQYPITVLDHANGLATLANDGRYNKAHFVLTVEKQNKATGKWDKVPNTGEKLRPAQVIRPEVAKEVTAVLKEIPGANGANLDGRQAAGKTGTWEYNGTPRNAHAWMVGYDPNVATAVWVGSRDPKKPTIVDKNGNDIGGGNYPARLWKRYMDDALKGKDAHNLPDVTGIGDQDAGNGEEPAPEPPQNGCAPQDLLCQLTGGNNGGGNNGGNNGGGNNGGGNDRPTDPIELPDPRPGGDGGGILPPPPSRSRN